MKSNTYKDAFAVLNRNSVEFGEDMKYQDQKAWPYWYGFIPYPYLNTDEENGGLGRMGFRVPAGRVLDIPVNLDRDTAFRLINLKYTVFRPGYGSQLTGDIDIVAGSTTVAGAATAFDTELSVGQTIVYLDDTGLTQWGVVARIDSATAFELQDAAPTAATGVNFWRMAWKWYDTVQNQQNGQAVAQTGTISIAAATGVITGVGTDFGTGAQPDELAVGDVIVANDAQGVPHSFPISSVTNNTTAATSRTGVAIPAGTAFTLSSFMPTQDGTITIAAGTNVIDGLDTQFGVDIVVGDIIGVVDSTGVEHYLQIATVAAAAGVACATTTETLGAAVSVAAGSRFRKYADAITGTSTLSIVNNTIADVAGSTFLADMSEGDAIWYVDAAGVVAPERAVIDHVDGNGLAKFINPVTTASGVGVVMAVGVHSANRSPVPAGRSHFYPLNDFVRVTLIYPSLRGRYAYGGLQEYLNTVNTGLMERPRLISNLQGFDDGMGGRLRTPSVQPYEGLVHIRVWNNYDEDIIINGHLFGYKIALENKV